MDKFKSDIIDSGLPSFTHDDLDVVIETYNKTMLSVLDKHAPLKKRMITIHPDAPWIDDGIKEQKREKRKAERKWRKTNLTVHREIYTEQRNKLSAMITESKKDYYQQQISDSTSSQSALFKTVDELLSKKRVSALPSHESTEELCNRMATFFTDKIRTIHEGLEKIQNPSFPLDPDPVFEGPCLNNFDEVTEEEVTKIIKAAAPKSCSLDPVPTKLVKECLDVLAPLITRIINQSFADGYVPKSFKLAAVTPLLKKANLIPEILKNFRPISNLPFLSKIMEKAATKQLLVHKETNKLREKMQSAYRTHHSTETALLRINHDLLTSLDSKRCVLMVMLDLSAAFDTVNHGVLLDRLATRYGVRGRAHDWIQSYLSERRQYVTINGHKSQEHIKDCDVPQGSVLGPNLYEDYTAAPVGDIFRKHDIQFSIYADDTQAYLEFEPDDIHSAIKRLEMCLEEIRQWMARNWLKLNDSKTEFIIFGGKKNIDKFKDVTIRLGDSDICQSESVKSIGANLDQTLQMDTQISSICRAAWFFLYQISKIRKYLTEDQAKTAIHAHVTSRLDFNNSLLAGLPKKRLRPMQLVQNAAARLITGIKKKEHVTPVLVKLHWLPVEKRIIYKVLLLAYKAMHGEGPEYLKELLTVYVPSRLLRSSGDCKLCVPKCRYVETEKRVFGSRAAVEWNKLPVPLRSKTSTDSFKGALKTYLFKEAYN